MDIMKKIVVPVDFLENTEHLVEYACEVAKKFNAGLYLVHVIPMGYSLGQDMAVRFARVKEDDYISSVEEVMQRLVNNTRKDWDNCQGKVFVGDPVEEILAYSNDVKADLLIISTHGSKGLEKILLGSVTARVVRRANCPVLSMNPHKMNR